MKELDKDYITVEQYYEYLKKNSIRKSSLSDCNFKFRKTLNENTFGSNVIERNNIIYIKKDYFYDSIKLYKNSIRFYDALQKINEYSGEEINTSRNIRSILKSRCKLYYIRLTHERDKYISKDEFEIILTAIDEIKKKKCITGNQFLNMINNTFIGIKFNRILPAIIRNFIKDNKLEFIEDKFIGNFYHNLEYLYPKDTVEKCMQYLKLYAKKNVKLFNITFEEYLAINKNDFENFYKVLEEEEYRSFGENFTTNKRRYRDIYRVFKDTNVKLIWIATGKTYVSKKEFYDYVDFKNNYVPCKIYFRKLGFKFSYNVATNNGIEVIQYKKMYYIKKENINKYIHVNNYNSEFNKAKSFYDKVLIKIKYYPNKNENNYPKFRENFMDFTKYVNKRVRTYDYTSSFYTIYNIILDNIKKDLEPKNEVENNKLFSKVIRITYQSQNNRRKVIHFVNYLISNKGFKLNRIIDVKKNGNIEPYTKEQFITLFSKLIEIVSKEDNLKKLYGNWNLSTAVSYVFMHYCLAWRKNDLVSQLPKPNLNLISNNITDGESFIRWIENGNEIIYEIAKDICNSLEEETKRLRKKAHKNDIKLNCIIPDVLVKEVATLLCINEANRQIHCNLYYRKRYEDRCFNEVSTRPKIIQVLLKENFNIDVEEILDGTFDNIRMNKGFLTLVKEKAEELNLFAYHYAEVLRGHSPTRGALAETTKIYLDKSIAKASVMAFATGTMGSVAYTLLQLVDEGFKNKSVQEQVEAIQNLNMTPYTIEQNIKVISNKMSVIKSEIQKYFKQGGYKKYFLLELLYGQNSYGIEEKTRCLIKITQKKELGIIRVKSMNYNDKEATNKWCPFNRKSCIGCQYMIALRYFIYEFEKKFNQVLDDLESAESPLDKEISIESINQLYIPLLNDLGIILGPEEVCKVIDTERYQKLVETV